MTKEAGKNAPGTSREEKLRRDLRQELTETVIQMLQDGTAPWQKPWKAGTLGRPFNPTTGKAYRGGNALSLMVTGLQRAHDDPRWLTFNQATQSGWQVRKGEKGSQIEFWDFSPKASTLAEDVDLADEKVRDKERGPIHRVYTVFNAKQIDGIEPYRPKKHPEWEVVLTGEQILTHSGAKILHDRNDQAFYDRRSDCIHLPPESAFPNAASFYGTALHEVGHWSGHPDRLNRPTLTDSYRFGDPNYAKEELRAELTSLFLAAERGIPHDTNQHAAYVGSWIRALKDDKNEIFRAAKDADRATDFLLALEQEKSVGKALAAMDAHTRQEPDAQKTQAAAHAVADPSRKSSSPVHRATGNTSLDQSFTAAQALSARALGSARLLDARTDSGIYRGEIVGETQHHVVQQLGPKSAVAHVKHLLTAIPSVGDKVVLRYSGGKIVDMAPFQPKALVKGLTR